MTTRREFLVASSAGTVLLAAAPTSLAQQKGKVWRIGCLTNGSMTGNDELLNAFIHGMRELGYVEGRNLMIERRGVDGKMERFPEQAAELVKLKVDAILAISTQATDAARQATSTIPIVMVGVGDPVGSGFIKTLARPGGNITGLSSLTPDLSQKQLEMLLSVRAKLARVAVLVDPDNTSHASILKSVREAASGARVDIMPVEARTAAEIAQAVSAASQGNAGAILVNGALFNQHQRQIADLAAKHRLVSISAFRNFAEAGGLMSYGQNLPESFRRAAIYVDKVLKGTKPADIPVEQPTKFELVINMRTAKALGITIPQSVLVRADRVIE